MAAEAIVMNGFRRETDPAKRQERHDHPPILSNKRSALVKASKSGKYPFPDAKTDRLARTLETLHESEIFSKRFFAAGLLSGPDRTFPQNPPPARRPGQLQDATRNRRRTVK